MRLIPLVVSIALINPAVSFALDFKFKGKTAISIDQKNLETNPKASSIDILEPHLDQVVRYSGIPFNDLMDQVMGVKWRQGEEILFTCSDGYQASIPVAKFKQFEAWLVWGRTDGKPFELKNKLHGNELTSLGPYYVVWNNQKVPELIETGGTDFPYQVTSLDVISFKERFKKTAPPDRSPAVVKDGFLLYRKYCFACHAIDGEGGQKAPDLKLLNPFERMTEAELKKWILSPSEVRPGTTMPAFAPKLPDREEKANSVITYLKVMLEPKKKR